MSRTYYRHFKGDVYEYLDIARHSETGELLVAYRDSTGALWVRPSEIFHGVVIVDGNPVPRFSIMPPHVAGVPLPETETSDQDICDDCDRDLNLRGHAPDCFYHGPY